MMEAMRSSETWVLITATLRHTRRRHSSVTILFRDMDLLEIGFSVVDCIGLAQDRYRWRALVNALMNLRVP
jgi:hypothetical protein